MTARPWAYLITFAAAALVAACLAAFFLIGIADGSVSSFNITLWLVVLAVTGAVLAGGAYLRSKGLTKSAIGVLSVLALPGVLYGLFILLFVVSGTRWN